MYLDHWSSVMKNLFDLFFVGDQVVWITILVLPTEADVVHIWNRIHTPTFNFFWVLHFSVLPFTAEVITILFVYYYIHLLEECFELCNLFFHSA